MRRRTLTIAALSMVLTACSHGAPPSTPTPAAALAMGTATPVSSLLTNLDKATAAKNWPQAITILDDLLNRDPTSELYKNRLYEAHLALGQQELAKGFISNARHEFDTAVQIDPVRPEAKAAIDSLAATPTPSQIPSLTPSPTPGLLPGSLASFPATSVRAAQLADFKDYLEGRATALNLAVTGLIGLETQVELLDAKPALLKDKDWRAATAQHLASIRLAGQQLGKPAKNVPPELAQVDADFVAAGPDLVAAADAYQKGIDQQSLALVTQGTNRLISAASKLDDAQARLDDAVNRLGPPGGRTI